MKVVVLGASGGIGEHVVEQALRKGYGVRAVYRSTASTQPQSHLEVKSVHDFFDARALTEVVAGADAVVSCLGQRRENPKNPWSKVSSPLDLMERFSKALIEAMTPPDAPKRLVVVSAAGVGMSAPLLHPVLRFLFSHSNVGLQYQDLARMEEQVEESKLDWTIVQPVTLTTGPLTDAVTYCGRYGLNSTISRADVAGFLLRCLEEPALFLSRRPMICTK